MFEYDYHEDIRVDISPTTLVLNAFGKYVNYQQPIKKFLHNISVNAALFAHEKKQIIPQIVRKNGKVIKDYALLSVFANEYKKWVKIKYFSARKQIIGKNPVQDQVNKNCALWGAIFTKNVQLDCTMHGLELDYLAEKPYRCWAAETAPANKQSFIDQLEHNNSDFLEQTKYVINPPTLNFLANFPNVPTNLSKSHIQLMAIAHYYKDMNAVDTLISMNSQQFLKYRKEVTKKQETKFDFRKFKHVRYFYQATKLEEYPKNDKTSSEVSIWRAFRLRAH